MKLQTGAIQIRNLDQPIAKKNARLELICPLAILPRLGPYRLFLPSLYIEPEEPLVKAELMDKNFKMINQKRFRDNVTSIIFKDGLKLNKRRVEGGKRKVTEARPDSSVSFFFLFFN